MAKGGLMKINSRQKGARGERQAAKALQAIGIIDADRAAQIGKESGRDVEGWPGVNVEVKNLKAIAALKHLEQSKRDAKPGEVPIALVKQDRSKFVLMVELGQFPVLCERYAKVLGTPIYPESA